MSLLNAPKARLLELMKLRASIFKTTFNPENVRTGARVLRKQLRGEAIKNYYYPSKQLPKPSVLNKIFPDLHTVDPKEFARLQKVANQRRKGKGPPKKLKGMFQGRGI
jgi:small subunit ribosomal protein S33